MRITVAAKELSGRGGSAGARIEKGDTDLAGGERAEDERQIADDSSQESEAKTGFYDNERAGQAGTRNHVAETQSEERGSAQVGIGPETGVGNRDCHIHGGTGTVLHKSEAEDQSDRPDGNQHEKR